MAKEAPKAKEAKKAKELGRLLALLDEWGRPRDERGGRPIARWFRTKRAHEQAAEILAAIKPAKPLLLAVGIDDLPLQELDALIRAGFAASRLQAAACRKVEEVAIELRRAMDRAGRVVSGPTAAAPPPPPPPPKVRALDEIDKKLVDVLRREVGRLKLVDLVKRAEVSLEESVVGKRLRRLAREGRICRDPKRCKGYYWHPSLNGEPPRQ